MTLQPGYKTIIIRIFSNISRRKAMKFGQLVEYNKNELNS